MRKKKVLFETLGCRYNRFESAEMAYELCKAGYEPATSASVGVDVVVINTCAVTAKSAARARAAIRNAKQAHPEARVVVTGCYSETSPEDVAKVDGADVVVGNAEKFDIGDVLSGSGGEANIFVGADMPGDLAVRPVTSMEGRTNAYLNVQSGCDEECSFCVVRLARGRSRSADAASVAEQVRRMSGAGIKEVVLTGINIGQYGSMGASTLSGLIRLLVNTTDIARIRLSSVNPNDVTDELIDLVATEPRVCRHLHIPLQSGSDMILQRMRRPYTARYYEETLDKLAALVPGIGLGADVMVGFPGETEEEFRRTYDLLDRSPLTTLHVFAYSPRPGADSSHMADAPPRPVAKQRSAALKELSAIKAEKMRGGFVGKRLDVLVENSYDKDGMLKGFTDNYIPVVLEGSGGMMNTIVPVMMIRESAGRLYGEVEEKRPEVSLCP